MPLNSGTRLGSYQIVEPLPSDGGGERYKAADTRSERLVTITVLPSGFSGRVEAKHRMERDAHAISALPRSGISGPVELGHQEPSTDFVVSEYIEGETLAARLEHGPMDVQTALETAVAVAESLDLAHRQGVVHGGLSPSTVMLTDDGPRLLDFGLASILEDAPDAGAGEAGAGSPASPVTASMATTLAFASPLGGRLPARAAYVAPEQLAGAAPDARVDIFALGTILYQMLAGRPAFDEKTSALLVAAIQTVDPDPVSRYQPMVSPALDHVVARCLAKDPRQRIQTAFDLKRQLQWINEGGSQVGVPVQVAARRQIRDRIVWAALAAGVILAVLLAPGAATFFRRAPVSEAVRFTINEIPQAEYVPVTVSPDGRWVVGSAGGSPSLIGVPLDSVTPQVLVPDNIVTQAFWSPDSRAIAFFEGGLLKRIDVAGGPAETISEAPPPIANGAWSTNGEILFSSGGVIQRVLAAGGEPTPATTLDETLGETAHLGPSFLPDGRHFLYVAISSDSGIYLAELGSDERTRLFAADSKPVYVEPGYILFNRGNTLFAQPFDAENLRLSGEPLRVTDGLPFHQFGPGTHSALTRSANFAVSQTGILVFKAAGASAGDTGDAIAGGVPQFVLEWRDRSSGAAEPVGLPAGYAGVDLAPGDDRFAVHVHEADGGNAWTFDLAEGRLQQLTFDSAEHNSSPVWSPDGERIAFGSQRNNRWGLYVKRGDGTGAEELIFESDTRKVPMSWSPDGRLLVYSDETDVWAVPVEESREPFPILNAAYNEIFPTVSPDGEWIAYQSDETGQPEIYIQQFDGPTKRLVSTDGGVFPRWRGDGGEIYYRSGTNLWAVAIDFSGDAPQPQRPQMLFALPNPTLGGGGLGPVGGINQHPLHHRFAVTADGQRFLVPRPGVAGTGGGTDDFIRGLAEGPANAGTAITTVILNWPAMLEER